MSRLRLTQVADPASPPASTLEIYYDSAGSGVGTPVSLAAIDSSGNLAHIAGFAILDYRLIKVTTVLQGTTTYTPANGTRAIFVEAIGAGGGGGGAATAVVNSAAAGGGGGGAYSAKWVTGAGVKSSFSCVVGLGGAGGLAGANNGTVGADSTFDVASICTAKGGLGGIAHTVAAGPIIGGLGGAGGPSASGVGDIALAGTAGDSGLCLAAAQALSGHGGAGFLGMGAAPSVKTQSVGAAGGNYGGGGGGACILSGGASVAGGAGGNGLIRIWEFS